MAWRPWYQPQLPHTTWGSLAAPQRGHRLRLGASRRQADARRLRLFDLEVFFFGTAIVVPEVGGGAHRATGGLGASRAIVATRSHPGRSGARDRCSPG